MTVQKETENKKENHNHKNAVEHQRKDVHMHYHHHYDNEGKTEKKETHKKLFFDNGSFPWIALAIFVISFISILYATRPAALPEINDQRVFTNFQIYSPYFVIFFALIFIIVTYILYGIKSAFKTKSGMANPVVLFVGNLFNLYWGIDILFMEKGFTDAGIAIIGFVGKPLFWSAIIVAGLAIVWFIIAAIRGDYDE